MNLLNEFLQRPEVRDAASKTLLDYRRWILRWILTNSPVEFVPSDIL